MNVKQTKFLVDKNEMVYFGDKLNNLRVKHLNRIIIAHLNIKSTRNKFICLVKKIRNYIDILIGIWDKN